MSPLSRREFIAAGAAAGAGLVIGFYLPHKGPGREETFAPNAYLKIAPDGKIMVMLTRSEMGQGVSTSLPMILAEELEADWKQIVVEQAGASTLYGDQSTGSASVKSMWDPLRKAGASAREMLISAAAVEWGLPRSACKAEKSTVVHSSSNRRATYGQLAVKAATLPVPTDPPLKKDAKDYKIVGQRVPRLDTASKVAGTAAFGIDFRLPGMKHAVLARCPVLGGKVEKFDDHESKKISGVSYVGRISDSAVAVVADSVWGAMEGRRSLNITWDEGPNRDLNSAAIYAGLKQSASDKAVTLYSAGDISKAFGRRVEGEYQLPFMAHAPMEAGNSVAHFRGSECEIWSPTQVPQDVRDSVAAAVGLDPDNVKVNITYLGGGFGRRLEHDYAVEAALVSKAINGPVQVLWSREDDMRNSTYRPASYHRLSAMLDGRGWPISFSHRIVMPSINIQKGFPADNGTDAEVKDEASFTYAFPNAVIDYVMTETQPRFRWAGCVRPMRYRQDSRASLFWTSWRTQADRILWSCASTCFLKMKTSTAGRPPAFVVCCSSPRKKGVGASRWRPATIRVSPRLDRLTATWLR